MDDSDDGAAGRGDDAGGVDPRFDPRFQRGYRPEPAETDALPPAETPRRGAIDPRFDPRFQRDYDPERHPPVREVDDPGRPVLSSVVKADPPRPQAPVPLRSAPLRSAPRPAQAPAELEPVAEPEADGAALDDHRTRNPFIVALWVVSAVIVAAGIAFIVQASGNPTARFIAGESDVVARTGYAIAPVLVSTGLTAMVLLALWHSVAWAARHGAGVRGGGRTRRGDEDDGHDVPERERDR